MTTRSTSFKSRRSESSNFLRADEIRDYLIAHPNFLTENLDLLADLRPTSRHDGKNILDMNQIVARQLGEEVKRLSQQQEDLLAIGRANQAVQKQVHDAALAVMTARNFEHFIHIITKDLAQVMDVDTITLCVEANDDQPSKAPMRGVYVLPEGSVDAVLGFGAPALLKGVPKGDPLIFGPGANLVRSQALIRLAPSKGSPPGLLALGSRDEMKFHPGQGSELLQFLCRLLERLIRTWLDLPI